MEEEKLKQIHKQMGYKYLDQAVEEEIRILTLKEREVLELINNLISPQDERWVEISKTQIEQGFMAIRRAIARPPTTKTKTDN